MSRRERAQRKPVTIRGCVSPIEPDGSDHIVAVSIITDDEEEYLVSQYGEGDNLLYHVDQNVEVTGFLLDDEGMDAIVVRKYRVVDGQTEVRRSWQ